MKKINKKNKILIIIPISILILTILNYTLSNRNLSNIEKIVKDTILTIEQVFYNPINNIFNNKYDKLKLDYELQTELVNEQKNTINELKKILDINYTLEEYEEINATVIKRNINNFYETLIIDKGEKDGIKEGSAVVTNGGLIGIVDKNSYNTSTVKLITSTPLSIKIKGNTEIYGILKKYKSPYYIIEGISENTNIEEGMEVLTTGLGSEIPSGIKIGVVVKEEKDHFDLNRTIYVMPSVEVDNVYYVKVLKKKI